MRNTKNVHLLFYDSTSQASQNPYFSVERFLYTLANTVIPTREHLNIRYLAPIQPIQSSNTTDLLMLLVRPHTTHIQVALKHLLLHVMGLIKLNCGARKATIP